MYLAYFDETYSKKNDENSTGEHAIIALVIPADKMSDLESALDGVVAKARKQHPEIPLYAELHAYELNSGVGSWKALKGKPRPRVRIYQDAIAAIARIDGLFVCRGSVDLTKRFCEDPHRWALTFALEHVNYCVRGKKDNVIGICDDIPNKLIYQRYFQQFRTEGTQNRFSPDDKLESFVDALHFSPSKFSRPIQAVDLLAYVYRRVHLEPPKDKRSRTVYDNLWKEIEPLFRRGSSRTW